jgi:hypothetical protein
LLFNIGKALLDHRLRITTGEHAYGVLVQAHPFAPGLLKQSPMK